MINKSLKIIFCLFFLQQSLAINDSQASEKKRQKHSHTSHTHKPIKTKYRSFKNGSAKSMITFGEAKKKTIHRRRSIRRGGECFDLKVRKTCTAEASWYGPGFHGKETKCHTIYNQNKRTAASNTLPCGSLVRVTHKGKAVVVKVTDTGSFTKKYGRGIDLSKRAAEDIDLIDPGHAPVTLQVVYLPPEKSKKLEL